MSRIIVLGAAGSLGKHVAEQALAAGHEVSVVVRTQAKLPPAWRERVRVHEADLAVMPPPELGTLAAAHDALVNTAGRMLKTEDGMILRDNVFGTLEQDAIRRDFTVNALFYSIADYSVIDYVNGMADLRNGLIRITGDPVVRFTEDPVRMVRAVRFAALLGFEIEARTYQALLEHKDKIGLASPARMYEEVQKLFLLGEGEKTFQMLRHTGMFGVLFPHLNSAWIDTEADGFPQPWVGKALEWVDVCVQTGRKVEPHILFSLMFGKYIEEKWKQFRDAGMVPLDALYKAVAGSLARSCPACRSVH